MIRKLRKNVEQFQKNEEVAMCATLIGSIIMSTGILTETPYEEQVKLFHKYANDCKELPTVIIDLVEYIWNVQNTKNKTNGLKANLVLISDKQNLRTPLVTIVDSNGCPMPLSRDGIGYGVIGLAREGRDTVDVEFLYDEDGEMYEED